MSRPATAAPALDGRLENVPITDIAQLREWALAAEDRLTVVGPEGPLAAGVVDDFRAHGLRIFGPTQAAAQLESSKAFSKAFMKRHGIPTAEYETFTDPGRGPRLRGPHGRAHRRQGRRPGGRQGRGGRHDRAEAHEAIDFMLLDNKLGVTHNEGGARVVIEEFLQGEEASFIVLCDGRNVAALATIAGPQAAAGRRPGAQHRRHGRLLAGAGGHARGARPGHARDHPAHHQGHGERRHSLHRLSLRRPDDRRAGAAQDARIQLPHGRPGNPAHHDAAEIGPASTC